MSIRNKLLAVMLLTALVPALALLVFGIPIVDGVVRQEMGAGFQQIAQEKAGRIEQAFRNRIREAEFLAGHPAVVAAAEEANLQAKGRDPEEITAEILAVDRDWMGHQGEVPKAREVAGSRLSQFLRKYQSREQAGRGEIIVTDRFGATIAMTQSLTDYYQGDEGWWRESFAGGRGETFLDDRGYDESVNAVVVGVVVPIRGEGGVSGILKTNFSVDDILRVVSGEMAGREWRALLARSDGSIVVTSVTDERHRGTLSPAELEAISGGRNGWIDGSHGTGRTIVGYAPVRAETYARVVPEGGRAGSEGELWRKTTWFMLIEIPEEKAFAPLWGKVRSLGLFALVVLMVVVGAAFWAALDLSRPIEVLREGVEAVADGRLEFRVGSRRRDEIGALGRAFDAMSERLQKTMASRDELDSEVEGRKRIEQRLRTAEERYRTLFEQSPDGIMVIDPYSGELVEFNAAAYANLGYGREEFAELTIEDIEASETAEATRRHFERLRESGEPETFLTRHWTKSGEIRDVLASVQVVDLDGRHLLHATFRDVTENKAMERRLHHAVADLRRSNRELEEFAYVASHDLQEPLRKVQAFSDLLEEEVGGKLEGEARDYLERMRGATRRMQDLIRDLLALSRLTTQARPFEPVELDEVVATVTGDLEVRLRETGGRIDAEGLPSVHGDPVQIRQLFQNLIGNALKFHRDDVSPVVVIRAEVDSMGDDVVTIRVEDNGIGFEDSQGDQIFRVFHRLHGRGKFEGTGMGLAICRKIVERHGGMISASGRPGEGARFTFTLPRTGQEGSGEGNG